MIGKSYYLEKIYCLSLALSICLVILRADTGNLVRSDHMVQLEREHHHVESSC